MLVAVAVAIASGIGGLARYGISNQFHGDDLPWATLAINVAGSFLLGLLIVVPGAWLSEQARTALGVGFLGGFTTFSTFSVQAFLDFEAGEPARAFALRRGLGAARPRGRGGRLSRRPRVGALSAAPLRRRESHESIRGSDRLPGQARRPARVPRSPSPRRPSSSPGRRCCGSTRFGLTANNVTYAVIGEAMSYWDFFPAEDGWGRVPMWGFAEVERSEAEGVEPGTRVYGYLPPVLAPGRDARRRRRARLRRRLAAPRGAALAPTSATWRPSADPFYRAGHRGRCRCCCARSSSPRS